MELDHSYMALSCKYRNKDKPTDGNAFSVGLYLRLAPDDGSTIAVRGICPSLLRAEVATEPSLIGIAKCTNPREEERYLLSK